MAYVYSRSTKQTHAGTTSALATGNYLERPENASLPRTDPPHSQSTQGLLLFASLPRTEPPHSQSTQGLLLFASGIHEARLLYWLANCNRCADDDKKYPMAEQCYFPPSKNPAMAYVYSRSTKQTHAGTTSALATGNFLAASNDAYTREAHQNWIR